MEGNYSFGETCDWQNDDFMSEPTPIARNQNYSFDDVEENPDFLVVASALGCRVSHSEEVPIKWNILRWSDIHGNEVTEQETK